MVVEVTDMDLTTLMVITQQEHHTGAVHNHQVTSKVTMHSYINHIVLGVRVEMDLNMVVEVLEVVKVSL